jgi:hypothetical protein
VECGWSRELGEHWFRVLFPGRESASAAEVQAIFADASRLASLLASSRNPSDSRAAEDPSNLFARIAEEMVDYRIERAQAATEYQAIRFTKVNLKRLASAEIGMGVLRALARDLGWHLREDEEGVTVPVGDLLAYFRRPLVRQLLDAKLVQCGLRPQLR